MALTTLQRDDSYWESMYCYTNKTMTLAGLWTDNLAASGLEAFVDQEYHAACWISASASASKLSATPRRFNASASLRVVC
jgi:hypothetical protein